MTSRIIGADLALPPFFCPIDAAVHDELETVERDCTAWLDRVRFYRDDIERHRVLGTRGAEFYARFAPWGSVTGVGLAARWVYWGFAFDDARCDRGPLSRRPGEFAALAGRAQRALETPHQPVAHGDRFIAALQDIGREFQKHAGLVRFHRFVDAHRAWLSGVTWQIANRAGGHRSTVDEYLAMRLNCAGGPPTFAMLEIANVLPVIPAAELAARPVRAVTEMACLVAALDNDLHSYRVERHHEQAEHNNIIAIMHRDARGTLGEAVHAAVALRDRIMTRFLHLRDRTARAASAPLRRYLADLGHGIRGNIDWGMRVPRYLAGDTAGHSPVWTETPSDPSTEPLPYPSIRWWWA